MRKVLFKKWIPASYDLNHRMIKGAFWEPEYAHEGIFHQWANAMEESSEGFGNYTVGLIELPDGTMTEVLPTSIKFIN